jgi:two-component system cell cycle response regulator CpdR
MTHRRKAGRTSRTARILLVEDDEDTRDLMAVALQCEGFAVEQASDAAEGLARLSSGAYDLVITDYDMPVKTGASMLKEAADRGLLGAAGAILVTAHPEPEGVEDLEIIRKPIELAEFLTEVASRLRRPAGQAGPEVSVDAPRLEAILYISSGSASSHRARRYMEDLLAGMRVPGLRFEVCDVSRDAPRAEADGVVYTPTLVCRWPGPPVRVVGDPSASMLVPDLLRVAGS